MLDCALLVRCLSGAANNCKAHAQRNAQALHAKPASLPLLAKLWLPKVTPEIPGLMSLLPAACSAVLEP